MRAAARSNGSTAPWLEALSVQVAAVWGLALGLDTAVSAALVYRRTHEIAVAALAGAGVAAASTVALVIALRAAARPRKLSGRPRVR